MRLTRELEWFGDGGKEGGISDSSVVGSGRYDISNS